MENRKAPHGLVLNEESEPRARCSHRNVIHTAQSPLRRRQQHQGRGFKAQSGSSSPWKRLPANAHGEGEIDSAARDKQGSCPFNETLLCCVLTDLEHLLVRRRRNWSGSPGQGVNDQGKLRVRVREEQRGCAFEYLHCSVSCGGVWL